MKYNDETLARATTYASNILANFGGTEIYAPLSSVFNMPTIPQYFRQVFVLTDGQVSNTEQVLDLIKQNNNNARVFSLGIGNSVSHHLVEGIARAGKGTSFFAMEGERMEKKVIKQLKDATQPALQKVSIDWGLKESPINKEEKIKEKPFGQKVMSLLSYTSPSAKEQPVIIKQAPFIIPPIFDRNHFRVYCIFTGDKLPTSVTVIAESPDGPLTVELPVNENNIIKGDLIHTLAARRLVRDLEEGTSYLHSDNPYPNPSLIKDEVIRLGKKYKLASKFTSFIAVEERTPDERVTNPIRIVVPQKVPVNENPVKASNQFGSAVLYSSRSSKQESAEIPLREMAYKYDNSRRPVVASSEDVILIDCSSFKEDYSEKDLGFEGDMIEEEVLYSDYMYEEQVSTQPSTHEQLAKLVSLQKFQGMFEFNQELAISIEVNFSKLQQSLQSSSYLQSFPQSNREQVWATVLAVIYLQKKLNQFKDEWEIVELKAQKWLASQLTHQELECLFTLASELIES